MWVDFIDNGRETYALGEPRHQGDTVRVPRGSGVVPHRIVARVHNGSAVQIPDAKVRFYLCTPPGSGDSGNFIRIGDGAAVNIPPFGTALAEIEWLVANGDDGHQCIRAEIHDWTLPEVPVGDPGFTDDITERNNIAQKNVGEFQPAPASPYEPILFDYSIANDGPDPEFARLQPAGLAPGMVLTVEPAAQWVEPNDVGVFSCRLELDIDVIEPGCASDIEYSLTAWRLTGDSWERWGGCSYMVRPRQATTTVLDGRFELETLTLQGSVTPSPGHGVAEVYVAVEGQPVETFSVLVSNAGAFELRLKERAEDFVDVSATFLGTDVFAASRSDEHRLFQTRLR